MKRGTVLLRSPLLVLAASAVLAGCATSSGTPSSTPSPSATAAPVAKPIAVKVFVASMFEIGKNTGDRAGEFQHWYERYWKEATPITVPGALQPVY